MSQSGDSLGELKVKVSVDVDVDGSKRQHQQIAADAVAANARAAQQTESMWAQAGAVSAQHQAAQIDATTMAQVQAADEAAQAHEEAARRVSERWGRAFENVRNVIAGMATAAVAGVAAFTSNFVDNALAIDRQARSLGMSTDEVQRWRFVAQQAGLEGNDLGEAIGQLSQRSLDAAQNAGQNRDTFERLGIAYADASGNVLPASEIMKNAADALARLGPGTEQTATAIQIFGEKGRLLLPVLAQGRDGINRMSDEFDRLGGGIDRETIESTKRLQESMSRLGLRVMALIEPIAGRLVGGLEKLADKAGPLIDGFRRFTENSSALRAAMISLGAAAVVAGGAMFIAFLPEIALFASIAIAVAGVGLAVDDLITTFEGGDSVIRRVIDGIFGPGVTAAIVANIQSITDAITTMWDSIPGPLKDALSNGFVRSIPIVGQIAAAGDLTGEAIGAVRRARGEGTATAPARRASTVAASPSQVSAASAATGGAASTVNATNRVQIQVNGLVDPVAFARSVEATVQQAIENANQATLEGVTRGAQ